MFVQGMYFAATHFYIRGSIHVSLSPAMRVALTKLNVLAALSAHCVRDEASIALSEAASINQRKHQQMMPLQLTMLPLAMIIIMTAMN